MTAFRAASLLLLVTVLWWGLNVLADTKVSIFNPGRYGTARAGWWINVTVEPDAAHRLLRVEADGQPGEYQSSDYALDGEKAARIRQVPFKALPAGCYWFAATVYDGTAKALASTVSGPVSIIGREGDPCPEN